jgi:5-methylthioribose kinase
MTFYKILIFFTLFLQLYGYSIGSLDKQDINTWLNKKNNIYWYDFDTDIMLYDNNNNKKTFDDMNQIEKKYITDILKEKLNIINYELYKYKKNKELLKITNQNLDIIHGIIEKLDIYYEIFNF